MRFRALLVLLALAGCSSSFGITVQEPPPPPPEPPRPAILRSESRPALERTVVPGVFRAVDVDRRLYYYEGDDLWYEYYKGRWHQAFSWNGVWFEPKNLPDVLRDVRLLGPRPR